MLDQSECEARLEELEAEAARLEQAMTAAGKTPPARPAFADIVEGVEKMKTHSMALAALLNIALPAKAKPATPLTWTERAIAEKAASILNRTQRAQGSKSAT
jgi:hypothetical protein